MTEVGHTDSAEKPWEKRRGGDHSSFRLPVVLASLGCWLWNGEGQKSSSREAGDGNTTSCSDGHLFVSLLATDTEGRAALSGYDRPLKTMDPVAVDRPAPVRGQSERDASAGESSPSNASIWLCWLASHNSLPNVPIAQGTHCRSLDCHWQSSPGSRLCGWASPARVTVLNLWAFSGPAPSAPHHAFLLPLKAHSQPLGPT